MTDPQTIIDDLGILESLDGLTADGHRHLDEAKRLLFDGHPDATDLQDVAANLGKALAYIEGASRAIGMIRARARVADDQGDGDAASC